MSDPDALRATASDPDALRATASDPDALRATASDPDALRATASDPDALRAIEAIVFAAAVPLTLADIARHVGTRGDLALLLAELAQSYAPRGINLVERGGRWHFQTAPDLAHHLRGERAALRKLSRAAVETLSVIAYHEPVTRPEIEEIRGVAVSAGTIDVLMEAGWVRPAGRRETPGRPLQYATTPGFLVHFGLTSRRDLPGMADLKAAGLLDREPPTELVLPFSGDSQ